MTMKEILAQLSAELEVDNKISKATLKKFLERCEYDDVQEIKLKWKKRKQTTCWRAGPA